MATVWYGNINHSGYFYESLPQLFYGLNASKILASSLTTAAFLFQASSTLVLVRMEILKKQDVIDSDTNQ